MAGPHRVGGGGVGLTLSDPRVTRWAGRATALHTRPMVVARRVAILEATRPAIVLGRAQKVDDGFDARAAAGGFEVARRVSGGTAVVVGPGECVWVDVIVERSDPGWRDDIGKASCWMGDRWVDALAAAGVGGAAVHRGPMQRLPGSAAVCFAGVGPGEVLDATGAKIVGISQRRTRGWALFQCAIPLRFDPEPLIAALGPSAEPARSAAVATLPLATANAAVAALVAQL